MFFTKCIFFTFTAAEIVRDRRNQNETAHKLPKEAIQNQLKQDRCYFRDPVADFNRTPVFVLVEEVREKMATTAVATGDRASRESRQTDEKSVVCCHACERGDLVQRAIAGGVQKLGSLLFLSSDGRGKREKKQ